MGKSSVRKRDHLYPATQLTGSPMRLDEYVERNARAVVVDHARLNPDYIAWHDRMVKKGRDKDCTRTYKREGK